MFGPNLLTTNNTTDFKLQRQNAWSEEQIKAALKNTTYYKLQRQNAWSEEQIKAALNDSNNYKPQS